MPGDLRTNPIPQKNMYERLLEGVIRLSNTGGSGLWSTFGLIPGDEFISIFPSGLLNHGSESPRFADDRVELTPTTSRSVQIAKTLLHAPHGKMACRIPMIFTAMPRVETTRSAARASLTTGRWHFTLHRT